ncbi:hypothetical protein NIES4101_51030 [Calothrix sp. NIES-4101]|nr:hypothetical protein NIES4101_51030 [Calothrix sp. NIES-4101]
MVGLEFIYFTKLQSGVFTIWVKLDQSFIKIDLGWDFSKSISIYQNFWF